MINWKTNENLLESSVDAIVNTINCHGVMGKGIALQFKQKFPENFKLYKKACDIKQVKIGKMFITDNSFIENPRYIINFPTKDHWKENSKIEYIEQGLNDLKTQITELNIKSISIPPLGCGNGGLEWSKVRDLIIEKLGNLDIELNIYQPTSNFAKIQTKEKPSLTSFRAIFLKSIEIYNDALYELGNLEIQKLVYFIKIIMNDNKLSYKKAQYGPYCGNLHNAIDNLAETYITGVNDGTQQNHITLIKNIIPELNDYINNNNLKEKITEISNIIQGYETPYGMELLGTVHWVIKEEGAKNYEEAINLVHSWNSRKKQIMPPADIEKAYKRLKECKLIS